MNRPIHPFLQPPHLSPAVLNDIAAGSAQRDLARELPFEAVERLKALRFGAIRLPVADGGEGASWRDALGQIHALGAADSNIAHIWRNHFMLAERLTMHGADNPVLRHLRDDVAGGALIGLAGAESVRSAQVGGGTPLAVVIRDGEGYRFSARKIYSTGSIFADWIVTYGELENGTRVNLVLPRERAGITLIDDWDGMGQRLTGTGTTVFDEVHVAEHEVIRPDILHPQVSFFSSTIAQIVLTTVIAGIITAIAREAKAVLGQRESTFYFAPSEQAKDDPLLLAALGERSSEAFAAEAIILAAAAALDHASAAIDGGGDALPAVEAAAIAAAKAKIVIDPLAQRAGSGLYDIAGASATRKGLNLDRHWRNLRTIASHNPASYKALAVGAHELNGTPVPAMGFF